ncbi:MAG: DUF692 domain-containing protein [Pseudomonadota bacterium]
MPGQVVGAGLGLRRALLGPLSALDPAAEAVRRLPDFLEVAPENWIGVGGRLGRQLRAVTERFPLVAHGLSLSVGGPAPLDLELVRAVGHFLTTHGIETYSEHLSYCSDDGHLYDLMPIPFTAEAVRHVAKRIRIVQEELGRRIAIENVSYYAAPLVQMSELEFLKAVLVEADCDLLLDVNNIYVNSINHRYDADAFLAGIPGERIRYIHVAGHYDEAPDLKIDTHGADVIDPVWRLLAAAYERFGARPTLLERDFNLPPLPTLLAELEQIRGRQRAVRPERALAS